MSKSLKLLLALVFLAFLFIYGMFDPEASNFFPKCPFLSLTGFQCPGCGSQRAVHQLIQGNFSGAFQYNPLLIIALPYILAAILFEFPSFKNKYLSLQAFLFGKKTIYLIFIIIVSFWIFRNVF